jgi:hypothetical protein
MERREKENSWFLMKFIEEVEKCLIIIENNPFQYQTIYKNIRRVLLKRFPYGIFYIIDENNIFILAITHLKRHPKNWKKRLTEKISNGHFK